MNWYEINCVGLLIIAFVVVFPWAVLRRDRWHPNRYRGKPVPRSYCSACAKYLPVDAEGDIVEHTFWWAHCPGSNEPPDDTND